MKRVATQNAAHSHPDAARRPVALYGFTRVL